MDIKCFLLWHNGNTMKKKVPHYHGNVVRGLFVLSAIILLVSLPLIGNVTTLPTVITIAMIIVLIVLGAITSSSIKWVHTINAALSLFGVIVFEYNAVVGGVSDGTLLFGVRQVLALIFLLTLYFSVRTLLGYFNAPDQDLDIGEEGHDDSIKASIKDTLHESEPGDERSNEELIEEIRERQKDM